MGKKIRWFMGNEIGKGQFGKVFTALDSKNGKIIAVKKINLLSKRKEEKAKQINDLDVI